jgi:hypothetical protein
MTGHAKGQVSVDASSAQNASMEVDGCSVPLVKRLQARFTNRTRVLGKGSVTIRNLGASDLLIRGERLASGEATTLEIGRALVIEVSDDAR